MRITIRALPISKVLFLLYVVYTNVTSYSLFFVRGLSSVLLLSALVFLLFCDGFSIKWNKSFSVLIVFALYSLGSGILVAVNVDLVISFLTNFVEYLVMFYMVLRYTDYDKKPDFVMWVFIMQSITAVLLMVYKGVGKNRISISEIVNVNILGIMFAFAIGFVLYLLISDNNPPIKLIAYFSIILLLLFGIMMTVSKKGIIAGAALIVLWIILCYRLTFARLGKWFRLLLFVGLIVISVFVYRWYSESYYYQVDLVRYRMSQLYTGDSDQERLQLIKEGIVIFLSHPLLGVGFNNARSYTSYNTYTHCFYSELCACTGILGTILFGYSMVFPWKGIVSHRRKSVQANENNRKIQASYMMVIYLVLLAVCWAQILFYTAGMMYVFAVVSGYAAIVYKDKAGEKYGESVLS